MKPRWVGEWWCMAEQSALSTLRRSWIEQSSIRLDLNANGYEFCVETRGLLTIAQLRSRATTTINSRLDAAAVNRNSNGKYRE